MKPIQMVVAVTLGVSAFIAARPVAAAADVLAPPAALIAATLGAHTHAACGTTCARHVTRVHRHHHHHAAALGTSAATTTRPQPFNPPRQRPEHRAALPRVSARGRAHAGPRDGQRAFAAMTGLRSPLTVTVAPLDPDQNEIVRGLEGFPLEGRGPPRAGPLDRLTPSFAGGLTRHLLSPAPNPDPSGSSDAPTTHGVPHAAPVCLRAASSYRFTSATEPPPSCSHACRPEGAAVCCDMPSIGGLS